MLSVGQPKRLDSHGEPFVGYAVTAASNGKRMAMGKIDRPSDAARVESIPSKPPPQGSTARYSGGVRRNPPLSLIKLDPYFHRTPRGW